MKKTLAFVFFAAGLAALAGCTTAPMMHAQPIAVPTGLTLQQVSSSVSKALTGRGWLITGATANSYDARLNGSDWRANIHIQFDTRQVAITYVSSKGLKYDPAAGTINRHWNTWMTNLEHDIPVQLSAQAYGNQ